MTPTIHYRIDAENRISSVSDSWSEFALDNGSAKLRREDVVGTSLWDWIADPETEQLYRTLIERVRTTGRKLSVPFRCDAPELRRFMQLQISVTKNDFIDLEAQVAREEKRETQRLLDPTQPRGDELIRMCGWCKKVPVADDRWLEVEDAITELGLFEAASIPQISHTVCPDCFATTMAAIEKQVG